jgi:hypothetical protein
MTPKRLWLVLLLLAAGLLILAWSQPWFVFVTVDGQRITIPGSAAVAGLLATGLASLALGLALTIAPKVLRFVLGGLGVVIALVALAVAVLAVLDPVSASASTVTEQTGVSGHDSIVALLDVTEIGVWPIVGIAGGVLALVAGVGVLATASRWPTAGGRYDRTPAEPDAWSALSEGDDPTR